MELLAIPCMDDSGFPSIRSSHFGKAPYFALIVVEPFGVRFDHAIKNDRHDQGHEAVAGLLKDAGVQSVIAIGIGVPMATALGEAGISVYRETDCNTVKEIADYYCRAKAGLV